MDSLRFSLLSSLRSPNLCALCVNLLNFARLFIIRCKLSSGEFVTARHLPTLLLLLAASAVLAQSGIPEFWTSKTSALLYRVTLRGQHLRAEKIFATEFASQVEQGAFVRCDYSQQGDTWAGKCQSHLPFIATNHRMKWCKFKFASKITLFTPTRIEGATDVWLNEDVDVDKCEVIKSHTQHFVWVPKT